MTEPDMTLYSDIRNIWEIFSHQNELEFRTHRKSEISSGGSLKFLTFELNNPKLNYSIIQNFTQSDSWFEYINAPSKLVCSYNKPVETPMYLSIWRKTIWERIFNLNTIKSNNPEFNITFSSRSNQRNLQDKIFQDHPIQQMLLTNELIVFNITTESNIMTISLKNMINKFFTYDDLEFANRNFKYIIETYFYSTI